jgi:hypothetical protein
MVGTSLFFYGNRYVDVPTNPALEPGTGDFTIDAWVIYAAAGNGQLLTIARKALGNGGIPTTAPLGSPNGVGYELIIQDSSASVGTLSFTMQGQGQGNLGTGGPNITPNTWHHVAFTLQRTSTTATATLYLDGAVGSTSTTPWTYGNVANTWDLLIGGDGVLAGEIAVDEVEIFNRALPASDIGSIFNAGSAGKCPTTVTTTTSTTATCVQVPSGIVSWWRGEGDAADTVGSNTGTLVNGAAFAPGMVGQAFSFNSVGSSMSATTTGFSTGSSDRTMDGWVKIDQFTSTVYLFGYGDFSGLTTSFAVGAKSTFSANPMLFFTTSAPPYYMDQMNGPSLVLGQWYFIAVASTGNTVTLYVNGAVVNTGTFTLNTSNNGAFRIGPFNYQTKALVDEVEVFNRALPASDIASIFDAGSAGKCHSVPEFPSGSSVIAVIGILLALAVIRPHKTGRSSRRDGRIIGGQRTHIGEVYEQTNYQNC